MTRNEQWPIIAAGLNLPLEPLRGSQILRSSSKIGIDLRDFFLRILGELEILWEKTQSASNDKTQTSDAARRRTPNRSPNIAQPRSSWMTQAEASRSRNPQLPTPSTGRTTIQHLPVSDLTLSQASQASRDIHYSFNTSSSYQNTSHSSYGSGSQYPYSQSHQFTYSQTSAAPRSTASPVENGSNGHVDVSRPYSSGMSHSDNPRPADAPSSSNTMARQPNAAATPHDYEPPVVGDFDQLVNSQVLPLPTYGGNTPLPHFLSKPLEYAWRAHELRASIRKMSAAEQHRTVTAEEIVWWNRLGESRARDSMQCLN